MTPASVPPDPPLNAAERNAPLPDPAVPARPASSAARRGLAAALAAVVGHQHVVSDSAALAGLSGDLAGPAEAAAAIAVAPSDIGELCEVARLAAEEGCPLVARGAGWSYTRSHTPQRSGTVLVDTRRLDRVVALSAVDRYVTVEAGVTWESLLGALGPAGLRTPFYGPLSGRRSTIGGSLSQNAVFYGSALHGSAADCVLGLDVVMADGQLLPTGSHVLAGQPPFAATFGPNWTGLFLGDSGAFGIKARATLPLIARKAFVVGSSFAVDGLQATLSAVHELSEAGLASEVNAFDPGFQPMLAEAGFAVPAGRFTIHAAIEADDEGEASCATARLAEIGRQHGQELAPTLAVALGLDPFGASKQVFSLSSGSGLPPVHAIVAHARSAEVAERAGEIAARWAPELGRHRLSVRYLISALARGVLVEPMVSTAAGGGEALAAAYRLRDELAQAFDDLGAQHLQLGRYYPYLERIAPAAGDLARRLKDLLDPAGRLNPGVIGLG